MNRPVSVGRRLMLENYQSINPCGDSEPWFGDSAVCKQAKTCYAQLTGGA